MDDLILYRNGRKRPPAEREHCPYCCNEGLIAWVPQPPPYGDTTAPCPRCEKGETVGMQKPWLGRFWHHPGRDPLAVPSTCTCFHEFFANPGMLTGPMPPALQAALGRAVLEELQERIEGGHEEIEANEGNTRSG